MPLDDHPQRVPTSTRIRPCAVYHMSSCVVGCQARDGSPRPSWSGGWRCLPGLRHVTLLELLYMILCKGRGQRLKKCARGGSARSARKHAKVRIIMDRSMTAAFTMNMAHRRSRGSTGDPSASRSGSWRRRFAARTRCRDARSGTAVCPREPEDTQPGPRWRLESQRLGHLVVQVTPCRG